jgi:hypothetical protein
MLGLKGFRAPAVQRHPVHVVPVELHGLVVLPLRVGEERPLHVLPGGDPQDGLRADALVDVQGDGVDGGDGRILRVTGSAKSDAVGDCSGRGGER